MRPDCGGQFSFQENRPPLDTLHRLYFACSLQAAGTASAVSAPSRRLTPEPAPQRLIDRVRSLERREVAARGGDDELGALDHRRHLLVEGGRRQGVVAAAKDESGAGDAL